VLVTLLSGTGDFLAGGFINDIVQFGALKADASGSASELTVRGRFTAYFDACRHAGGSQDSRQALVDVPVAFTRAQFFQGKAPRNHESIRPVFAVIHHAASGHTPADIIWPGGNRELSADERDFLAVTESPSRSTPAISAQTGGRRFRITLEQEKIIGHVFGRACGAMR
jgi:hypothetical protein